MHALEHVEHAVDVLLVVPQRLFDGFADLLARGEVDDGVDVLRLHDFGKAFPGPRSGDVHTVQTGVSNAIGPYRRAFPMRSGLP